MLRRMNASTTVKRLPLRHWLPAALLLCAAAALVALPGTGKLWDFLTLRHGFLRATVLGTMLLALNCGLLGPLLVARRMTMLSDTLSHAVLPGIAAGYLWTLSRNPVAMLAGAVVTGVLSSLIVSLITRTTRLKADAALSVVLTVFFAAGIALIRLTSAAWPKAGLARFLYGQAAAVSDGDVVLLGVAAAVTMLTLLLGYRGFLVLAFDEAFGHAAGLPVRVLHYLQMLLTTLAIVVSMEVVGVILVAGLLIIPASTAWLLSSRLHHILWISALLGMAAAPLGAFFSYTGQHRPAGPSLVLCSALMFAAALLFSPRNGLARKWWTWLQSGRRIQREDTLKAIYRHMEAGGFQSSGLRPGEASTTARELRALARHGFGAWKNGALELTPEGFREATRMVRNHRLWELYLTQRAGFADDHVHESAERMEHLLAEENIAQMMQVLGHPETDPHGKRIPSMDDSHEALRGRGLPAPAINSTGSPAAS
jgi:ABC-type Mn2+/Zn2+ transport system permease subunit/Mn-dependent DtxR family transcriptional regulator